MYLLLALSKFVPENAFYIETLPVQIEKLTSRCDKPKPFS